MKWICKECGYLYDPLAPDPQGADRVAFPDLPSDWVCPKCGSAKEAFFPLSH
jgi:rubredoxin